MRAQARSQWLAPTEGIWILASLLVGMAPPCKAEMRLEKVIVDFTTADVARDDIEIANTSHDEILYVSVQPAEIVNPGQPDESRVSQADPEELGLLVSPRRMILEPGQSKLVRFSLLERPRDRDRIYRVSIKPAVGELITQQSGLKIVVGYDVLVIARPLDARPLLKATREGKTLTISNTGNTNALLYNGLQCPDQSDECDELPSRRIYAGASWRIELPLDAPARFLVAADGRTASEMF